MKKLLLVTVALGAVVLMAGCLGQNRQVTAADTQSVPDLKKIDSIDRVNNAAAAVAEMPTQIEAQTMAHQCITAQSISPGDVDFIDETERFARYNDSSYVFAGNVKMPTADDGKAIQSYNVSIKWLGGDWNKVDSWTVKFCNFGDPN